MDLWVYGLTTHDIIIQRQWRYDADCPSLLPDNSAPSLYPNI